MCPWRLVTPPLAELAHSLESHFFDPDVASTSAKLSQGNQPSEALHRACEPTRTAIYEARFVNLESQLITALNPSNHTPMSRTQPCSFCNRAEKGISKFHRAEAKKKFTLHIDHELVD